MEIPFPHRTIYFGEASKPFDIHIEENKENEVMVKKWIREILVENTQRSDGLKD